MLTITHAQNQRGWSHLDHRLDDDRLHDMIGRRYPTLAAIKRDARERADANSYPTVYYRDEAGDAWKWDGSPRMPGRDGDCIIPA